MNNSVVERRRALLINTAYYALIIAVFYLIFKTFFGVLMPFIVAFIFAAILQKPVKFLDRKTPVKRSLASPLCVLLLIALVLSLFFLIGMGVADKVKGFYDYAVARLQNITELFNDVKVWLLSAVSVLPRAISERLTENIVIFFDDLIENGFDNISMESISESLSINWSSVLSTGGGLVGGLLKGTVSRIPSVAISCIISVVACVFMTVDFDKIKHFLVGQFSEQNAKRLSDAFSLSVSTLKKMLKAYGIIILITFAELSVGFYILKLAGIFDSAYIPIIAIIIAVIDIIPVLGTGTVLIPWAVYSLITGNVSMGVGLIIIYIVILVIRQVLEPRLVAGQVGLPPVVTIIAMYIGTKTLGVLGFFILPFIVILIKEFNDHGIIHIFRSVGSDEDGEEPEKKKGLADIIQNMKKGKKTAQPLEKK